MIMAKTNKMIMAKGKSKRTIKVSKENKAKLARLFNCTERMVYKALCFECETILARKIQHVARKEMGGWVEAAVPESEIFYDTMENGRHVMRQYFENGAVLEVDLRSGQGVISFKAVPRMHVSEVKVCGIERLQEMAREMR